MGFICITSGGYNDANTYTYGDYSNIEFVRIYNKYTGRIKNDIKKELKSSYLYSSIWE